MSSPLRVDPEQADADTAAAQMLAADADRARLARDWRTTTAGGPPAVVARDATPERWHCHITFGMVAARHIARVAADADITPSEYVRNLVLADIAARTGADPDTLRENLTVHRKNRARALRA